jgi:hypothetical protein
LRNPSENRIENLAESSKEGYGQHRAALLMMMMMHFNIITTNSHYSKLNSSTVSSNENYIHSLRFSFPSQSSLHLSKYYIHQIRTKANVYKIYVQFNNLSLILPFRGKLETNITPQSVRDPSRIYPQLLVGVPVKKTENMVVRIRCDAYATPSICKR